jgi:DNA (cytosine-5)-methyltransferase 1
LFYAWSSCKREQSALKKNKGKLICETDQIDSGKWLDVPKENCLATIDILLDVEDYQKGCNKLVLLTLMLYTMNMVTMRKIFSSLFNVLGVSFTKWTIEYDEPDGEAFSKHHLEAVLVDNSNVILK